MPPKLAAIFNRPRQDTPPAYIASFCRIELSSKFGNSIGASQSPPLSKATTLRPIDSEARAPQLFSEETVAVVEQVLRFCVLDVQRKAASDLIHASIRG
jgi:hypothetical protein